MSSKSLTVDDCDARKLYDELMPPKPENTIEKPGSRETPRQIVDVIEKPGFRNPNNRVRSAWRTWQIGVSSSGPLGLPLNESEMGQTAINFVLAL